MGGGAGGGGIDPKIKQRKIEMYSELNRQLLLAQLQGLGGGPGLSRTRRQNRGEKSPSDIKHERQLLYERKAAALPPFDPLSNPRGVPYVPPDPHRPTDTIVGKQGRQMYSN